MESSSSSTRMNRTMIVLTFLGVYCLIYLVVSQQPRHLLRYYNGMVPHDMMNVTTNVVLPLRPMMISNSRTVSSEETNLNGALLVAADADVPDVFETATPKSLLNPRQNDPYANNNNNATLATNTTAQDDPQGWQHPYPSKADHDVNTIPSYTIHDIARLAHHSQARLHVLLYDPMNQHQQGVPIFQLYSLSSRSDEPTFCICREHVVQLLLQGLLTARFLDQHNAMRNHPTNQDHHFNHTLTPLQLLLDTVNDYPFYACMDHHDNLTTTNHNITSCSQERYPPLMTIGSVPRDPNEAPFLHALPLKYYNNCLFRWRQRHDNNNNNKHLDETTAATALNHSSSNISTVIRLPGTQRRIPPTSNAPCVLNKLRHFATTTTDVWESLVPQVYWRGTSLTFVSLRKEFRPFLSCEQVIVSSPPKKQIKGVKTWTAVNALNMFLPERDRLQPRCLAVVMTLQAQVELEQQLQQQPSWTMTNDTTRFNTSSNTNRTNRPAYLPWINVKYTANKRKHRLFKSRGFSCLLGNFTSPMDMSKYKYQIDFGGTGGTTWLGTITKLAMPGLLFHHETPTKDWFHDEIQPWVHYVPIHTNLSNLYDMYVWAETHPNEAQQIAQQGQAYARYHISESHLATTFDRWYVQRLNHIANAYQPQPGETVDSILQTYRANGLFATLIGTCDEMTCDFSSHEAEKDEYEPIMT